MKDWCYKLNRKRLVKLLIILLVIIGIISLVVFLYNRNHKTTVMERRVETYTEYGNSIISNSEGFIVIGSNNHNLNKIEKASISKYDSNRNKVLEKVYNKGYNSTYYDIIQDGDSYIVVGSYEATKKELEEKIRTAFIVKYDKNLEILFENDFQVIGDSHYYSVIKVDDGYIVCGDGVNTNSKSFESGATLIKYDFDGKEVFRKYTGNVNAIYKNLLYLGNYIYACGVDNDLGIISKYDLYGNLIDTAYYDDVEFTSIVNINDRLYLSGIFTNDIKTNGIIVSYDTELNKINEVIYDKYSDNKFNKLLVDNDGIIVIGEMYYYDDEYISDGIIGKYTKDLMEKSVIRYNGNRNILFKDVLLVEDKYIVIGNYNDNNNIISKMFVFSLSLKSLGA